MCVCLCVITDICTYQYLFCRILDCGNHTCERVCHDGACDSCALLPDHVTHCPCGATPLEHLLTTSRTSCLDPIPTCNSVCEKLLPCSTAGNLIWNNCTRCVTKALRPLKWNALLWLIFVPSYFVLQVVLLVTSEIPLCVSRKFVLNTTL